MSSNGRRRLWSWLARLLSSTPTTVVVKKRKEKPACYKPGLDALEDRISPDVALTSIPTWTEQGPQKVVGAGDISFTQPDAAVIGPIQSILTHPTDVNTVYASSPG